jgi:CRP-like cAMP-binding protein
MALVGRAQSPLVMKLSHFAQLSHEDVRFLDGLCAKEERFGADETVLAEGEPPRSAFVLTRGMACRYRLLPDGRRQILTFLIPGDFYDPHLFLLDTVDHSVSTIVPSRLAAFERDTVIDIIANNPRISASLWWAAMQEAAMLRERIVALGRRDARGRVAYLLCELVWRHAAIGQAEDNTIRLPLTQTELADTLGLTSVHTNRVLQEFRADKLITLEHRRLTLLNIEDLQGIAGFNQDYLHFGSAPKEIKGDRSMT